MHGGVMAGGKGLSLELKILEVILYKFIYLVSFQ